MQRYLTILFVTLLVWAAPAGADTICRDFYVKIASTSSALGRAKNNIATFLAGRIPAIKKLKAYYQAALLDHSKQDFFTKFLGKMNIKVRVSPEDKRKIPATGPAIFIANHPHGFADGLALMSAVQQVRGDVKVLMFDIMHLPAIADKIIPIRLGGSVEARRAANAAVTAEAKQWLADGHSLVMFPAGKLAGYSPEAAAVLEQPWKNGAVHFATDTNATVVPIFIEGQNSAQYYKAKAWHPGLGTALLPAELVKLSGKEFGIRIGHAVEARQLTGAPAAATNSLRERVLQLGAERAGAVE